ncbi:MAG: LLM class flavin-dependent oxidoreductase, partial [Actinobacteria bacterium]|nr:LLM class flavin-dependent oxidoreductase [Actinomycetota bacterium]
MDVGLSVESRIPGLDRSDLIDAIVERAHAADEAGLVSLHVGDRHQVDEPYVANLAIAGHLAAIWPKRLGVLVISSMWNPVLLAEQLATLSAMTSELDVVVAMGDGEAQFASVGVPISDRLALFTEGLAVTQALLAGETVTARVGPHDIVDARVDLRGNSTLSWFIAASAPRAIRRAAKLGAGWLASAKLAPDDAL